MGFKKVLSSSEAPIIIGSTTNSDELFPPGFSYELGGVIRIVKADVTQEVSSPMREVSLSDGSTEIIPIESLKLDMRDPECNILEPDKRYVKKVAQEEVVEKKIVKKKANKNKKKKNGR